MVKRVRRLYLADGTYNADGLRGRLLVDDLIADLKQKMKAEGYPEHFIWYLVEESFHNPTITADQVRSTKLEKDANALGSPRQPV